MNEELELWKGIQKECIDSLKRHGAILEAVTDRGQPVLRKNPAVETLAKAERKILLNATAFLRKTNTRASPLNFWTGNGI
jgi:hypothetical protein